MPRTMKATRLRIIYDFNRLVILKGKNSRGNIRYYRATRNSTKIVKRLPISKDKVEKLIGWS